MLSPSLMPNLPCHATPSILKTPPPADTVSWKTLDSTFSPSDPTYYRLVSGEQSYFLSFHWWQLPRTTYIPWPTDKCLDCNVSPVLAHSPPDLIPAFPLCALAMNHAENLSCVTPSVTNSFLLDCYSKSQCFYADHTHFSCKKYLTLCSGTLRRCKVEHVPSHGSLISLFINFQLATAQPDQSTASAAGCCYCLQCTKRKCTSLPFMYLVSWTDLWMGKHGFTVN